ncbi:histamine H2 receptor-like isoform X2 [Amphibalanus amphitrite]|uniref:histamine H2 receptor-like isoform X2 n=1 Tax=Amphibalanus amphitrite TaxID=1232801 RepID=UPI001C92728F|nr:histamine H2 receptor-like isoform X2 [Amphibalanus amphitrite]
MNSKTGYLVPAGKRPKCPVWKRCPYFPLGAMKNPLYPREEQYASLMKKPLSLSLFSYIWLIHKYISMTRPFSRFMTRQKILALMAAAWLWCIGYNLTPQMGLTHTVYKRGTTQCGPEIPSTVQQRIHSAINSLVNLYLPLGVMIFCYFRIFQEIRAHLSRMRENSNMAQRSSVLQQQRIAVTLCLVLACFLLCMAPYMVYSNLLAVSRGGSSRVPLILNPISYWFLYLSSVLNPIIYGARSSTFRQSYREILCGAKRSKILTVGSLRSVGSTRLYSHRVSAPATSPCESPGSQSTPARWLEVPPVLHGPKPAQLSQTRALEADQTPPDTAQSPPAPHTPHRVTEKERY